MAKDDDSYIKKGNKITVSATIDPDLYRRLQDLMTKKNGNRSQFIERAIESLIKKEERKK